MPEKNSPQVLSGFVIKIIGLLTMTLDHIGLFVMNRYFGENPGLYQMGYVFRCIGRIAMPIFALFIAEGVIHTQRPWRYFFRLLAMHLAISLGLTIYLYAIPNPALEPSQIEGNAFADLSLLALTLILFRQRGWRKALSALPIAFAIFSYVITTYERANLVTITWFPAYIRPGYSIMGLLIGIGFYFAYPIANRISKPLVEGAGISMEAYQETRSYRKMVNLVGLAFFFFIGVVFWGISYIGYSSSFRPYDTYWMQLQSYMLLAIIPIYFYSGKRGYDSKAMRYITYFYYPVHLAIIFLAFSL